VSFSVSVLPISLTLVLSGRNVISVGSGADVVVVAASVTAVVVDVSVPDVVLLPPEQAEAEKSNTAEQRSEMTDLN